MSGRWLVMLTRHWAWSSRRLVKKRSPLAATVLCTISRHRGRLAVGEIKDVQDNGCCPGWRHRAWHNSTMPGWVSTSKTRTDQPPHLSNRHRATAGTATSTAALAAAGCTATVFSTSASMFQPPRLPCSGSRRGTMHFSHLIFRVDSKWDCLLQVGIGLHLPLSTWQKRTPRLFASSVSAALKAVGDTSWTTEGTLIHRIQHRRHCWIMR